MMRVAPRINNKGDVVFYTLGLQWKNIMEMYIDCKTSRGKETWRWIT